jgi:hypothetical protein
MRAYLSPLRGSKNLLPPSSWGSRPRLTICRRSAARKEHRTVCRARLRLAAVERRRERNATPKLFSGDRRRRFPSIRMTFAVERRRRDRCLARGVSNPGDEDTKKEPPKGATDG